MKIQKSPANPAVLLGVGKNIDSSMHWNPPHPQSISLVENSGPCCRGGAPTESLGALRSMLLRVSWSKSERCVSSYNVKFTVYKSWCS